MSNKNKSYQKNKQQKLEQELAAQYRREQHDRRHAPAQDHRHYHSLGVADHLVLLSRVHDAVLVGYLVDASLEATSRLSDTCSSAASMASWQ